MAYGLSNRAFVENGPAEQAAAVESRRSTARTWRALSHACRLAIVERALRPTNENIDGFPAAL